MAVLDCTSKYCIIGAGSSGITAAKNLKQVGIAYDVFEREDDIGGNWYYGKSHSSVYRSIHLISSRPLTEYTDFPMPSEYPDYPSHAQVLAYFKEYVRHFDLEKDIQFNTEVTRVEPDEGGWLVTLGNPQTGAQIGETRRYAGVIIANGHNWHPKFPEYPGTFTGKVLHSCEYKTADVLREKRVLVVGAGNSGCDIAVEAAQNAARTFHSVRRGYYYVPKYLFGKPADQVGELSLKLRVPLSVRRAVNTFLLRMVAGTPQKFGLPKPDHKLFETHPIVNSQMLYYVGHGDITPRPDVQELRGERVLFADGSEEPIDVIIYATGFKIVFPFMETALLNWKNNHPSLYLNVFHPEYDNLFVVGLIQPDSGQWGLEDIQAQIVARYLVALKRDPAKAARLRELKKRGQENYGGGVQYKESTRHYVEVEHFSYRHKMQKVLAQLG
ncbi:MAG TPA: NAD(P)-binding domain-containing protein [Ktedonobacterales bacterium]